MRYIWHGRHCWSWVIVLACILFSIVSAQNEPRAERTGSASATDETSLLALVRERLPDWKFETPPGGLSVWAELPQPVSTALAAAAHELGVRIAPGGRFGVDGAFDRFVRLPYAYTLGILRRYDENKADTHIESGEHLALGNLRFLLHHLEEG